MTATATRSSLRSWDLESPIDEAGDWKRFAACLDRWDLFTGFLPKQFKEQALAIHICVAHCPVLSECAKFTAQFRDTDGVVQAGIVWNSGRPSTVAPRGHGDHCAHLRERS